MWWIGHAENCRTAFVSFLYTVIAHSGLCYPLSLRFVLSKASASVIIALRLYVLVDLPALRSDAVHCASRHSKAHDVSGR